MRWIVLSDGFKCYVVKKQERGIERARMQEEYKKLVREGLIEKVNLRKDDVGEVPSIAGMWGKRIPVRENSWNKGGKALKQESA